MKIIGRRDRINLPEWGMNNIETKIDTGAYGNAIHCHHMEVVEKDGQDQLRFQLLDPSHPEYEDTFFYSREFKVKKVKSSSGEAQMRFVLKTDMHIGGRTYHVEFSLSDRSEMKYPVLLGRKFLKKKFLVDVSQIDVFYKSK